MNHTLRSQQASQRTPLYRAERAEPLRVIMVVPPRVPSWLVRLLDLACDHSEVRLQALVMDASDVAPSPRKLSLDTRLFLWLERILLRAVLRLRRRPLDGPLSRVPLPERAILNAVPVADLQTLRASLADARPDLVLLYGRCEWAGALAETAKHGCWVLDGDLLDAAHAGVALLAPILAREQTTPVSLELQLLGSPDAPPQELTTSRGATRAVSFSQQRDLAFLKLPSLMLRAMRRLPLEGMRVAARLQAGPAPTPHPGAGLNAAKILLQQALQSHARRVATNQPWFVVLPEAGEPMRPDAPRVRTHRNLLAPGRNYWADPFLVKHGEECLLFVEEFIDERNRGVISCLRLQDDGSATNLGMVLEEPFHLSYPQVFRWKDAWYMTVESCEADRASLYRSEDFPYRWERVNDLLQGWFCVDPTLHWHEGRWYLFANVSESGGNPSDELFLFVADELEGPYLPHPGNPIVADTRNARPAGQLFQRDGRLYRPAQCCAPVYGAAVVFNEVLALGPDAYRERVVSQLAPDWALGSDGCHTYNAVGSQEVLDVHGRPPPEAQRIRVFESPVVKRISDGVDRAVSSRSGIGFLMAVSVWPWPF